MKKLSPEDLATFAIMEFFNVDSPLHRKGTVDDWAKAAVEAIRNGNPGFGEMNQRYAIVPLEVESEVL